MLFTVTQSHIDSGEKGDAMDCPIALAIRDKICDKTVYVSTYNVLLQTLTHADELKLPNAALDFIYAFDAGDPVVPFTFEINL